MVNSPMMWIGEWTLYSSSSPGFYTLFIHDTKADCASSPWCSLAISLEGDWFGGKKTWQGRIEKMDDVFRHMIFYIDKYKYEVNIFVDRNKMAGIIYLPKPAYFYAIKK